jgi:hypothetical protein
VQATKKGKMGGDEAVASLGAGSSTARRARSIATRDIVMNEYLARI